MAACTKASWQAPRASRYIFSLGYAFTVGKARSSSRSRMKSPDGLSSGSTTSRDFMYLRKLGLIVISLVQPRQGGGDLAGELALWRACTLRPLLHIKCRLEIPGLRIINSPFLF